MPEHVSIDADRLYPQPDYSVQIDQEGKWTVTQVFACHREAAVRLMPRPGSTHPEVPFVAISRVTARISEADLAEITCVYSGAEAREGEDEKENAVYNMGLSLTEEPLLSHQRYKNLNGIEREAIKLILMGKEKDDEGNRLRDKVVSALGQELLAKIDRGQTHYYSPRVTWRESWVRDKEAEAAELNDIGKISEPEGPVPTLANDRNWLLNGLNQTQEGKSFRLELEWLASDRGGWDPHIYGD